MKDISKNRKPDELRQMLDYLGVAAFVIDVASADEFRLAAINTRHEQLSGMKHSKVAGRSVDELLTPKMPGIRQTGNWKPHKSGANYLDRHRCCSIPE